MKPLHEKFGDLKFEKGFKYGFLIGWVLMSILAIIILLSSPCNAQDKTDTTPVTILVRISGKPWAFFHDGWEVVISKEYPKGKWFETDAEKVMFDGKKYVTKKHLLYLDSRKRPIRKEWVIYQTFKR